MDTSASWDRISCEAISESTCSDKDVGTILIEWEVRTEKYVRRAGMPKHYTPLIAAADLEKALRLLEGRWKLVILFHLFGGKIMRFSDLEREIGRAHV